jgi:hypothetical protein
MPVYVYIQDSALWLLKPEDCRENKRAVSTHIVSGLQYLQSCKTQSQTVELDYYVMAQTCERKGKWRENRTAE